MYQTRSPIYDHPRPVIDSDCSVGSGFSTDKFSFGGFLRLKVVNASARLRAPPNATRQPSFSNRLPINQNLVDAEVMPDRQLCVAGANEEI
jgi:hypothetical protein